MQCSLRSHCCAAVDSSWWRTAVWYARRKHISTCVYQTEENRRRAQELLDRNAESNRKAEQKRKGKEKEREREKMMMQNGTLNTEGNAASNAAGPSSSSSSSSYYYKDYVAPLVLEE